MILESHVSIRVVYGDFFGYFEAISIYIFSLNISTVLDLLILKIVLKVFHNMYLAPLD